MQKQKGFTIIELIVVIAIIAVLASIVMVNVVAYINKAKDSSIKANLNTIRTNAVVYMSDTAKGNGDYNGFLNTTEYTNPASQITNQGGAITKNCNDYGGTCTANTATKFCVSSTLPTGGNFCIDSDGKTGTALCAAGVCP